MSRTIRRNRRTLPILLGIASVISAVATLGADDPSNWSIDPAHTEINFSVRHFFTPVTGSFEDYDIALDYDAESPEKSSLEVRVAVASVNTGNEERDAHLRTADWFEADTHPYMHFESTSVRQVGDNRLIASGPLTIKGISRQIELPVTLLGNQMIPEPMREMLDGAKEVASFQSSTRIDRGDFEVGTGSWAETMVVSGDVDIEILLEAHNK